MNLFIDGYSAEIEHYLDRRPHLYPTYFFKEDDSCFYILHHMGKAVDTYIQTIEAHNTKYVSRVVFPIRINAENRKKSTRIKKFLLDRNSQLCSGGGFEYNEEKGAIYFQIEKEIKNDWIEIEDIKNLIKLPIQMMVQFEEEIIRLITTEEDLRRTTDL